MSNKQNHIRQLLKRWISGDINAADEQRLDNAAKDDQFLGEALSGLRSTTEKDHAQRIASLRKQLKVSEKKKGLVYMPILRIAAAVVLLIVAGWFVLTGPQLGSADLAMSKSTESMEEVPVSMEGVIADLQEKTEEAPNHNLNYAAKKHTDIPPPLQSKKMHEAEPAEPSPAPPSPVIAADIALEEQEVSILKDEEETIRQEKARVEKLRAELFGELGSGKGAGADNNSGDPGRRDEAPSVKKDDDLSKEERFMRRIKPEDRSMTSNAGFAVAKEGFRVIEGTITDSEGYPLIGANIREKGSTNGAITDVNGFFTITVVDNNDVQLSCSYTGYETNLVSLDEEKTYQIALSEGMELSEVVVTGRATRSSKSINYSPITVNENDDLSTERLEVQPVLGFRAFKNYIRQNTPDDVGRGKIHLGFTVDVNGRPINITVLHSTNHALDALAIQLVSTGPNWVVTNGELPVEVEYRVKIK